MLYSPTYTCLRTVLTEHVPLGKALGQVLVRPTKQISFRSQMPRRFRMDCWHFINSIIDKWNKNILKSHPRITGFRRKYPDDYILYRRLFGSRHNRNYPSIFYRHSGVLGRQDDQIYTYSSSTVHVLRLIWKLCKIQKCCATQFLAAEVTRSSTLTGYQRELQL